MSEFDAESGHTYWNRVLVGTRYFLLVVDLEKDNGFLTQVIQVQGKRAHSYSIGSMADVFSPINRSGITQTSI